MALEVGQSLVKVNSKTVIKQFDCGDEDLNDFLMSKSILYAKELLATTYLLENEERTIAFFSIFNDNIMAKQEAFVSKSAFKRFLSEIVSHPKRHLEYFPAIKIGRLGVCSTTQRGGIGKTIVSFVIDLALNLNTNCACKFISVDAYAASLAFYEKMGFNYLTAKDEGEETRQMYLDLTPLLNTMEQEG